MVLRLLKLDKAAFNPYLERNTKLSYITGLRGMSTAFDSLCLWNFHTIMGKSMSIPKAYALQKTLVTDIPQFTIQILYVILNERDNENFFVSIMIPIINSIMSVIASIFTALTASSCPIDVEEVRETLKQWHLEMKDTTN
jgi:hypothetical protein